jgi:energy-coupling factor transporter ATP-binding protein EcfA2
MPTLFPTRHPSPALPGHVEAFRSFTMAHPRLVEAKHALLDAIESSSAGSLILVVGPTGAGKTTLRRKVEETLTEKMAASMEIHPGQLPFISVEAVAQDNGNFQWRDHFQRMLIQIHEPLIDHKIGLPRGDRGKDGHYAVWPRGYTGYQLQQSVENAMRYRRPAAVFIDEAQHLARMSSGRKLADQLDVIKSIASRTETIHVLIGTYELLAFRNLSGQLSRRSVDLHFCRYRAESADDLDVFRNVVFTFQNELSTANDFDLLGVWDFLYERSLGCIGILKDWLVRALIASSRTNTPALNLDILQKTALSGSQCEKILAEAREGEAQLTENNDARLRLRQLLNFPDNSAAHSVDTAETPKGKRGMPGRRPQRDPIGKARAAHA